MARNQLGARRAGRRPTELLVLGDVRARPLSSRTEIAQRTGLSLQTVSATVGRLLAAGLVQEEQTGASSGGRPPILLTVRADRGYVVGVKLMERSCVAVLADLEGTIVARRSSALRATSAPATARAIAEIARQLVAAEARGRTVFGVGIGLAGVVDRVRGVVRRSPYTDWRDVPLRDMVADALELPVVIDNDVNALATDEQLHGAGRGCQDLLVVTVGRGIGLGLVLNGSVYRGAFGGAGELGHVKVAPGPACDCGASGCLEALTSDGAVARQVSAAHGRALDIREAVALARSGDAAALAAFRARGRHLGAAVAALVNVVNPEKVVLAGEGMSAADLFVPDFTASLLAGAFANLADDLPVVVHPWRDEAWARGAASLVLGELFAPDVRVADDGRPSLVSELVS